MGNLRSMTGMAAARGDCNGASWSWDLRSVNGRGLDLRLRLPETPAGLESALRARLQARLHRGSVSLGLRLNRDPGAAQGMRIDPEGLQSVLRRLRQVESAASDAGVALSPADPLAILALREVTDTSPITPDESAEAALLDTLTSDFENLLNAFDEERAREGRALETVIAGQIDRISELAGAARVTAETRRPDAAAALNAALARLADNLPAGMLQADPQRLAQELALLTVKSDVTEELDRLEAHVTAARALLDAEGPVGRRFDFLMQEFMREANTLCSKAGHAALTAIGLDLKQVIDQMREQVQNLE